MLGEIKEEYLKSRRNGSSRDATVAYLKASYRNELTLGCEDDGLLFWVGLADAQYACKELSSEVAEQALTAIEKLIETDWDVCSGDLVRRQEHYASAPMPERKHFGPSRKFRCTWKIGDVFAYHLTGAEAQERGLDGAHVLLRKVDELESYDGRLLPVVTLTMWTDGSLPTTSEEFQNKPMLILSKGRLSSPPDKSEYRTELLISSRKKLEQLSLVYLGNFLEVTMPSDEFIIRQPGCIMMTPLNRFAWECCTYLDLNNYYMQHSIIE